MMEQDLFLNLVLKIPNDFMITTITISSINNSIRSKQFRLPIEAAVAVAAAAAHLGEQVSYLSYYMQSGLNNFKQYEAQFQLKFTYIVVAKFLNIVIKSRYLKLVF